MIPSGPLGGVPWPILGLWPGRVGSRYDSSTRHFRRRDSCRASLAQHHLDAANPCCFGSLVARTPHSNCIQMMAVTNIATQTEIIFLAYKAILLLASCWDLLCEAQFLKYNIKKLHENDIRIIFPPLGITYKFIWYCNMKNIFHSRPYFIYMSCICF